MGFLSRLIHPSSNANSSTATAAPNPADNNARPHVHRTTSASSTKRHHDRAAEERIFRHLILISDTRYVGPRCVQPFQAEGFDVTHIPFGGGGDFERDRKALENLVHEKEDELETGERYAIVGMFSDLFMGTKREREMLMADNEKKAYHRPAYLLLASHHLSASNTNPFPLLCALIAYYPLLTPKSNPTGGYTAVHRHEASQFQKQDDNEDDEEEDHQPACMKTDTIFSPETKTTYLPIQIHIAGRHHPECNNGGCPWPWISASPSEGDVTYKKRHRCYVFEYPEPDPGPVLDNGLENDAASSQLAWSRMLGCLRRSFGVGAHWPVQGIETVWEAYWMRLWSGKHKIEKAQSATGLLVDERHGTWAEDLGVECVPTAGGGEFTVLFLFYIVGRKDADRFQETTRQPSDPSFLTHSSQLALQASTFGFCPEQ
ncbi:hypothetical protein N7510_008613 [Penicillium lagena]|uniref:uncharacterized protein n=1 Tax=Penicillium lagena TaxID=94218 RepID=UPI002541AB01|nr:uncharacterized protein N7510_008613 [Penicillium lagena]KAJ5605832.1 hypothetical protein N7510_008613 [Penicillium lagena]